jgi:type I restriction enzyme, R subunit
VANNHAVHRYLVEGVPVEYQRADGSFRGDLLRVLDYDEPENNEFLAVNQFTVVEEQRERRPDVVLFVNGLPLAVIELKNAADENADIWKAFNQLQTYKQQIPSLFAYNEALVISDGLQARIGTLTAGREWFLPWRTIDRRGPGRHAAAAAGGAGGRVREAALPRPDPPLHRLRGRGGGVLVKKMAGYHQYHAVNVAVEETVRACAPAAAAPGRGARVYRHPRAGRDASRATGASAWSGTPRARARA